MLLGAPSAQAQDSRLAETLAVTIGIDMHNHVYPAGTEPHARPGQEPTASLDLLPELKLSGLRAVCAAFVLDFTQISKPGDALANYLTWVTALDAQLEKSGLRRALSLKEASAKPAHPSAKRRGLLLHRGPPGANRAGISARPAPSSAPP